MIGVITALKVLHVVNDANTGGAQTLIETLSAHASTGDEVHVMVLMGRGSLSGRLEKAAASVSYAHVQKNSLNIIRPIRILRNLVASLGVDVVHSHLLQSDLVCLMSTLRVPHVSTVHTSGAHESNTLSRMVSRIVALLSPRFDAVVACSPSARVFADRMGYHKGPDLQVIYNGSKVPTSLAPALKKPNFVCLSRWHPMKDHATLLRAFAIFSRQQPGWRLLCAGQDVDPSNKVLTTLISDLSLQASVDLMGPLQEVQPLLDESRALVISSSHGEALPMAGIEALAQGVPVVTTDVGDCSSLVVEPSFLVTPSSPHELAKALDHIASRSSAEYEELQDRSWRLARSSFDAERTARAYRGVYRAVITN